MIRSFFIIFLILLGLTACLAGKNPLEQNIIQKRLPPEPAKAIVFFFVASDPLSPTEHLMSDLFLQDESIVITLNVKNLLTNSPLDFIALQSQLLQLAKQIKTQNHLSLDTQVILASRTPVANLIEGILSVSTATLFKGGFLTESCPTSKTPFIPVPLVVVRGKEDVPCIIPSTQKNIQLMPLEGVASVIPPEVVMSEPFELSYLILRNQVFSNTTTDALPLIEDPADHPKNKTMAFVFSGDGGWTSIDKEIGEGLSEEGISVVGFDSLKYFWTKKNPDQLARDVTIALRHYLKVWPVERIALIGYSRGADVIPFIVNRLPADLKQKISFLGLLGLEPITGFEFHLQNWFTSETNSSDTFLVEPEITKITGVPILCLYGTDEDNSLCKKLPNTLVKKVALPGGHHFDGAYDIVTDSLKEAMP